MAQIMIQNLKRIEELRELMGVFSLAFAANSIAEYNGISIEKREGESLPSPFEITFVTDDIEGAWKQAVEAGAIVVKEPAQKPWGQIVGYLRDINGFLVEVCTRVA
jgi:lactoylglutathione lyase